MTTIVTRAGKGSALTHTEADANFNNLNDDKVEEVATPTLNAIAVLTALGAISDSTVLIGVLANNALKLDGSALVPLANVPVLTYAKLPAIDQPYIYIRDEKASGTAGGGFTSGAWQTRDLNTEVVDTDSNATISSNVISLAAGTYRFRARALAHRVLKHKIRLHNITDAITYIGTSENADSGGNEQSRSVVSGRFTIAATKSFEVQHRCSSTRATNGFGLPSSFSVVEVYTEIEFWKEVDP